MKDFLRKNKKSVILAAILFVITVLLCIPATIKLFASVFGYAVYFYLVLGYAYLIVYAKKIPIRIPKGRFALYVATVCCVLMTLHVGIMGEDIVNSGFVGYVSAPSEMPATVGGVIFCLVSIPIVLPCKYIASVVIFFLLTAVCGFFVIKPLVFETTKKPKKSPKKPVNEEKKTEENKSTSLYSEPIPEEKERTAEPAPIAEKEIEIPQDRPVLRGKDYARMRLFGPSEGAKSEPTAKPQPPTSRSETPVRKSPLHIVDDFNAVILPPNSDPYTTNDMRNESARNLNSREQARQKLYSGAEEDYRKRLNSEEKTVGEDIGDTMKINPYIPNSTIYESAAKPEVKEMPREQIAEEVSSDVAEEESAYDTVPSRLSVDRDRACEKDLPASVDASEADEDEERLPTIKDSEFLRALRAEKGVDAPKPLLDDEEDDREVEDFDEEDDDPRKDDDFDDESEDEIGDETVIEVEETERKFEPIPSPKKEPVAEPKAEAEKPVSPPPPPKPKRPYMPPPVALLKDHVKAGYVPYVDRETMEDYREVFEVKLKNYNIDVKLIDVIKGPTVSLCILELGEKCPISKVMSAQKDISRVLKCDGNIQILEKIPNTEYFGIEVPNAVKGIVSFKEVITSAEYTNAKGDLLVAIGKDNVGKIVVMDIAEMPHALVAGSTGSGKSVCINAILASLLYRYSPDEVKLVLIDLKFVEMANFAGLPHMLFKDPLNEVPDVINALKWLSEETLRRFNAFKSVRVRNLNEYNDKMDKENKLPRIVLIIDEASELMTNPAARKPVEQTASTLARLARAAGIHMLFATQNPVRAVITSEIQNNLNTKIAFAVGDRVHSQVILKENGAENLLGKGDMLIKKSSDTRRAQCAFISTEEVEAMVNFIRDNNDVDFDENAINLIIKGIKEEEPEPVATDNPLKSSSFIPEKKNLDENEGFVALSIEALKIFVETDRVSATYIQRRFSKGYNTVANIMDYLEEKGYISPQVNNKRQLLITKEKFYELYPDKRDEEPI